MSTDGGGKVKNKRTHTHPKPYDRRKSLLDRVGDKVRGMFGPSWLTGFVGKKKITENQDDESSEQDGQTFSMEERNPQPMPDQINMVSQQSPSLYHQGQLQMKTNSYRPPPPDLSRKQSNHVPPISVEAGTPTFTSAELPFSNYTKMLLGKESLHEDNQSMHSDNSTSGCSSMIPHPDKREYQKEVLQMNESSIQRFKELNPKMVETPPNQSSVISKQSTVQADEPPNWRNEFSASYFQPQSSSAAAMNKPSFNASLFGCPLGENTSLLGDSIHESSFYHGRTTYGGASASRKRSKLNVTAPYQSALPIRKQVKAKPLNNSFNAVTSSTARRILETLERMSSPLTDAKKIPSSETSVADSLPFTPASYRKPTRYSIGGASTSSFKEFQSRGPPLNKITTPSIASIAKNRQTVTSSREKSSALPEKATCSINVPPTSSSLDTTISQLRKSDTEIISSELSSSSSRKMKRDKSYQQRASAHRVDEDEMEIPNLRTDFTLPTSSMPKFDFGNASTAGNVKKPAPERTSASFVPPSKKSSTSIVAAKEESPTALQFTFSTPIQNPPPSPSVERSSLGSEDFTFSSPLKIDSPKCDHSPSSLTRPPLHKTDAKSSRYSSVQATSNVGTNDADISQNSSLLDLLAKKNDTSANSRDVLRNDGVKPASELKQGSVLDILGKLDKISNNEGSVIKPSPVLKSGSVKDVLDKLKTPNNVNNSEKKAFMPVSKSSAVSSHTEDVPKENSDKSNDLWSSLTKSTGKWDCTVCLVQNRNEDSKCVACQTPNLESKSTSSSNPTSKSNDLWSSMSKPSGWSCSVCLVQNKKEDSKCLACQTPNPDKTGAPSLNPTSKSNDMWSSISKQSGWSCSVCLVQNKKEDSKCVACMTTNPNKTGASSSNSTSKGNDLWSSISKQSGWSCSVCLVQNKKEDSKCVACMTPNPDKTATPSTSENTPFSKTKKPAGNWECDTCLVQNKGEATKCCACETPKPGCQASAGGLKFTPGAFSTSSSFTFANSSSKDLSSSEFKFGGSIAVQKSTPSGGGEFADNTGSSKEVSSAGGFKFGVSGSLTDSDNGGFKIVENSMSEKTADDGGFKFGTTSESKSNFTFGTQTSSQSTTSSDITKSVENKPIAGGFQFSAPSSDLSSEPKVSVDSVDATTREIGDNQLTKPSGGFTFGNATEKLTVDSAFKPTDTSKPNNLFSNSSTSASFGAINSSPVQTMEKSSFGGFNFSTDSAVGKPLGTGSISSFQPSSISSMSDKQGGFAFKAPEKTVADTTAPLKRGRDEETGSSDAKKPAFANSGSGNLPGTAGFSNIQSSIPSGTKTTTSGFSFGGVAGSAVTPVFQTPVSNNPPVTTSSLFQFGTSTTAASSTNSTVTQNAFQFGTASTSQPSFTFGQSATKTSTTSAVFQFGSSAPSASTSVSASKPSSMPFQFAAAGANQTSTAPTLQFGSGNTANTFGNTGFSFNQQPSGNTSAVFGALPSTQPSNTAPVFGSSTATTSSTPSFGTPGSSFGSGAPFGVSQSSTVPMFGSSVSSPFGQTSGNSQTGFNQPSTTFGGNTSNGPLFQFGAKPAEPAGTNAVAPQAPSSGFAFGQTANPAAPAAAANATGGFNFSATPSFSFSNTSSPNPQGGGIGTFNVGATSSDGSRKIKKAVRKINRK